VELDVILSLVKLKSYEAQMAEVDINDILITRFIITRHRFDPETNHFRWMPEVAFDRKREWTRYLNKSNKELEKRRQHGAAHHKEHITGYVLDVDNIKNNDLLLGPRQRLIFILFRRKKFLPGYESAWSEYKALYPEG
jgi:hypothetical protein